MNLCILRAVPVNAGQLLDLFRFSGEMAVPQSAGSRLGLYVRRCVLEGDAGDSVLHAC